MLHKDGSFRWMLSRGVAVHDASGTFCVWPDHRRTLPKEKCPTTDGFANRLLFIDRVGRLVKHTKRHKDHLFAVLFMDLDGFKMINTAWAI